jgi:hypothetical protein
MRPISLPAYCVLLSSAVWASGCVERRFTVVSNPPGAMLLVDRREVGATPVTLPTRDATYYGTREFMLIKDGYEPLLVRQPVPAPCYGYFPIDFLAENVWPWSIVDERVFTYQLAPQRVVPAEALLQSATGARARATGIGGPAPPRLEAPLPASGLPPGALPVDSPPAAPAPPTTPPPDAGAAGRTTGNRGTVEFD